jgi:hypothetical protein
VRVIKQLLHLLASPLPLIPSRQGRGKWTFYGFIKIALLFYQSRSGFSSWHSQHIPQFASIEFIHRITGLCNVEDFIPFRRHLQAFGRRLLRSLYSLAKTLRHSLFAGMTIVLILYNFAILLYSSFRAHGRVSV